MRLLLLSYAYSSYGGDAGVATEALARTLASRGVTVDVVAAGDRSECRTELLWDGDAAEEGLLNVHRVHCRRTSIHQRSIRHAASYLLAALPVIRRLLRAEDYDAIHVFSSLPAGALLPFLHLGKTPVIVSLRGPDVPGYDSHDRDAERAHVLLRPLTRWIWRRADRVVAESESLGRLARRTLPGLDYTVIPNGVDLPRVHPPAPRHSRRPFALAAAIRHLREHRALRADIGRRNHSHADATPSWDRVITRYLSLYNGVRGRAGSRPRLAELPSSTW